MSILGYLLPSWATNPYPYFAGVALFAVSLVAGYRVSVSIGVGILATLAVIAYIDFIAPKLGQGLA